MFFRICPGRAFRFVFSISIFFFVKKPSAFCRCKRVAPKHYLVLELRQNYQYNFVKKGINDVLKISFKKCTEFRKPTVSHFQGNETTQLVDKIFEHLASYFGEFSNLRKLKSNEKDVLQSTAIHR